MTTLKVFLGRTELFKRVIRFRNLFLVFHFWFISLLETYIILLQFNITKRTDKFKILQMGTKFDKLGGCRNKKRTSVLQPEGN